MISLRRTLASRLLAQGRRGLVRSFSATGVAREVQVFDMPSMSPTMEEGGIVEWSVKQGDKFSAGDVLLEIETDKAQIAVEAGDDGILAKILVEAGAKGIPVGRAIAVTAEEGDDIAAIDYDALLKDKQAPAAEAPSPAPESTQAEPAEPAAPASKPAASSSSSAAAPSQPKAIHGKHGLGPLPTAVRLMHENQLSESEVAGSGPYGRITKGDVLAHLGKIPKGYVSKEQERFESMEKMDLSNVQPIAPRPSTESAGSDTKEAPVQPEVPQPLVTRASIPLTTAGLAQKVPAAQRVALRTALLSLKPRPSVLRDSTLDLLTAPTVPPFKVKRAEVVVLRAKPVSLEIAIEEPPAAKPSKAVEIYIATLEAELAAEPAVV